ncbi:MAG: hypothetical protein HY736_27410 [Verrucomicrobia bacterium]|nr:hypothetical protein [Verrucomicrobiota bacterium]
MGSSPTVRPDISDRSGAAHKGSLVLLLVIVLVIAPVEHEQEHDHEHE